MLTIRWLIVYGLCNIQTLHLRVHTQPGGGAQTVSTSRHSSCLSLPNWTEGMVERNCAQPLLWNISENCRMIEGTDRAHSLPALLN